MTLLARHSRVKPDQREFCGIVIERHLLPPAFFVVTGLASLSKLAFVRIVGFVASDARRPELIFVKIALMTAVALDWLVRASKRKLGIFIVVESNCFPFACRMAGGALFSKTPLMHVVNFMAINAQSRQVFIALANVTDCALHVAVSAFKRELSLIVIEGFLLFPSLFRVA